MPPTRRDPRIYIRQETWERLDAARARMIGELGRVESAINLISAVIEVGLDHHEEVIAKVREQDK